MIDYLVIGHISKDVAPGGTLLGLGGSASYGALTAVALGKTAGILTSTSDAVKPLLTPLDSVDVHVLPSERPTTFEISHPDGTRLLRLLNTASPIHPDDVPAAWQQTPIIHLAPIANEIIGAFDTLSDSTFVCATLQGWLRRWDNPQRRVEFTAWAEAAKIIPSIDAIVISIEDLAGHTEQVDQLARLARLFVVTQGAGDVLIYQNNQQTHIPVPHIPNVVDTTGAGDIFATSFFVALHDTGNVEQAVRFAAFIASDSITRAGMDSIPTEQTIQAARAYMEQSHV